MSLTRAVLFSPIDHEELLAIPCPSLCRLVEPDEAPKTRSCPHRKRRPPACCTRLTTEAFQSSLRATARSEKQCSRSKILPRVHGGLRMSLVSVLLMHNQVDGWRPSTTYASPAAVGRAASGVFGRQQRWSCGRLLAAGADDFGGGGPEGMDRKDRQAVA